MNIPKRVFIYMQDWIPCINGSGTNNRMYSNVRAYLDLGCEVEVICIQTKPDFKYATDDTLQGVKWTRLSNGALQPRAMDEVVNRAAYWLGWPLDRAFDYAFKTRAMIREEVLRKEAEHPGSLHHFEYLSTACTSIHLEGIKAVWSLHDIESNFLSGHLSMRRELHGQEPRGWEKRSLKYMRQAERLSASDCRLVLCIARHECELLRREWGCEHAAFYPMSLPIEEPPPRTRKWKQGGKLRLFHLGRIDSLPSFRSLQFLLEKVFPLLTPAQLKSVEMVVVGEVRESDRARTILKLAEAYPQVTFSGFQEEVRDCYGEADLQVVGSTEATGLRTRIVESFAWGVPVLSTTVGAEGVEGLVDGENILLADDGKSFASAIGDLISKPARLQELAEGGLKTYSSIYSRAAVAARLQTLLQQYVSG